MSGQPPSASQQTGNPGKVCKRRTPQAGSKQGGSRQVYFHSVTDTEAALLTEKKCQEIRQKTGADIEIGPNPSEVQNLKIIIIRGTLPQIEVAVRVISQETGCQETISAQAETFWQQWVEASFPDLDSCAYFLPPVYFNRVPMTKESAAGQEVLVLHQAPGQAGQLNQPAVNSSVSNQSVQSSNAQYSDIRDDAVMQRFLFCLQKMSEENRDVFVGLSQLQFGQYLGEPCYAAAAAHLPVAKSLPTGLSKNKRGDFDVLLIHRQYGIVACEVKAFGDNVGQLNMSQQDTDKNIRSKLTKALLQLDKAEAMLSHLVSDLTPGLRITKTIVAPNLTARQVQQAISGDPKLMQDLCRCLGITDPADIPGLCVCSDQLSDPKTPWDVSSDVLRELGNWWQRRVAESGPDSHMTCDKYKTLVARFCGPATTVTVPCTSPPRLCVKTLGQAVSWTGECYTAQITLFPEQVHLLNTALPRVFVAGPPGTGKTVVLLLKATEWLRCGDDVYIVSTCMESRVACSMLYHLLLQIVNTQLSLRQPHLLQYDFDEEKYRKKAMNDLSLSVFRRSLYVIADEVIHEESHFKTFCDKLLRQVPSLQFWAASCYHEDAPVGWHVEYLTRPLRSPPVVVREVKQDDDITNRREVQPYSERGVAEHTDGPPVRRLYHRGPGHSVYWPCDCVTCGREVAKFLHSLCVLGTSTTTKTVTTINSSTTPPCIQWRDVFVLSSIGDNGKSSVVTGLREGDIPVQVMKDDDIEDVATARSDVVWVADGDRVRGMERKVVICVEPVADICRLECSLFDDPVDSVDDLSQVRLHHISRCTSQLVIVFR